jgi:ankyrin repeat protein
MPQFGDTSLHRAAEKGHVEVCRLLIAAGADANTQSRVSFFGIEAVAVVEALRLKTQL